MMNLRRLRRSVEISRRPLLCNSNSLSLIVLACLSMNAHAADKVTLNVIGDIEPATCEISADTTTINYGKLDVGRDLKSADVRLPSKKFTVSIRCNSPTRTAVKFIEDRPQGSPDGASNDLFSLGISNGSPVGGYTVELISAGAATDYRAGSAARSAGGSRSGESDWSEAMRNPLVTRQGHLIGLFGPTDRTVIGDYINSEMIFSITPILSARHLLSTKEVIKLDGQFTIELYLL